MNVLIVGATGMVGQGVLREALLAQDVESVLTLGRSATGQFHARLREVVQPDLLQLASIEPVLATVDACFFTLGTSSAGMAEDAYARVTYDLTLSIAGVLARLNPAMTFVYVSGQGTDTSERGRIMWARVKGRTENALLRLPFRAFMFRPGLIMPLHGIRSKTRLYRAFYRMLAPLAVVIGRVAPNASTTTEQVGRAMLEVARHGYPKRVLEMADINSL